MVFRKMVPGLLLFGTLVGAAESSATGAQTPAAAPSVQTPVVPPSNVTSDVRVEVVLSRRQGQKVISSRPFELVVTPNQRAQLRQGIDVYVSEKESRFIGTNIDVTLRGGGAGRRTAGETPRGRRVEFLRVRTPRQERKGPFHVELRPRGPARR